MGISERVARTVVGLEVRILRLPVSYGPTQLVQYVSPVEVFGPVRLVHGSKWPISNSLLMLYARIPRG